MSRATATLMIHGDNTNATESANCKVDFRNAWITLKQELKVDLYVGAYPAPVMSMPNFVKQVVETVQAALVSNPQKHIIACLTPSIA
jgi:Sec-independent protein secretion pathway component TatC